MRFGYPYLTLSINFKHMDTIAELVYEKADIDTRLALHQAYGVYKSIYWVQNFAVPRATLEGKMPAILAKRKQYPDVTVVEIHEGCKYVRHMNNIFYHEEVIGPSIDIVKHSTAPLHLRHWSLAFDNLLRRMHVRKYPTKEQFFDEIFVHDERFFPLMEEKITHELNYHYLQFQKCMIDPVNMGLPYHEQGGYYVRKVKQIIRHLEDVRAHFDDYVWNLKNKNV